VTVTVVTCTDKHEKEMAQGFVDDSALIAVASSFSRAAIMIEGMMSRADGGMQWSQDHNSRFEITKSLYVGFSRKRERTNRRNPIPRPPLHIDGKTIAASTSAKNLGVIFDQELRWNEQSAKAVAKATKWTLQYRRLAKSNWGLSAETMRRLYISVAIPKLTYALDVWCTPVYRKPGLLRDSGSVGVIRRLATVQRLATLGTTGAMRTTATDTLDAHANLLPTRLLVRKHCHNALLRMATLPEDHPLARPLWAASRPLTKSKPTTLNILCHILGDVCPGTIETIPAFNLPPWEASAFRTVVSDDRKAAVDEAVARTGKIELRVYSDGSGFEGQAAAAAVLYQGDEIRGELRYRIGPLTEHTVYEAEAVGVTLGLHLLLTKAPRHIRNGTDVDANLDNQAVIMATDRRRPRPGHQIMQRIHQLADRTSLRMDEGTKFSLRWTPGHEGIQGNEQVDDAAKRAAMGDISTPAELPAYLRRKPMKRSAPATRQAYKKVLQEDWRKEWLRSKRNRRMRHIDSSLPSNNYIKLSRPLRRAQLSMLTYLRTGHAPLNHHLHRIKCIESPACPHCPEVNETVRHFLFECPEYRAARNTMDRALRRRSHDIAYLFTNSRAIQVLTRYVADTKRWERHTSEAMLAR
jgi:ribonuclease HI